MHYLNYQIIRQHGLKLKVLFADALFTINTRKRQLCKVSVHKAVDQKSLESE